MLDRFGAVKPGERENEEIIDTSRMSEGKRRALEVAEAAREQEWASPSFAARLFMGEYDATALEDFPVQTEHERRIGDELCAKVEAFLRAKVDPEEVDATRTIPPEAIEGLFEMGVFAMKIPKKYGGLGLSQVNYNRVMMLISSWCASTAVLVSAHQSIGVPQPLKLFGTEEQKERWFPRFRAGTISAFALTEPSVGSDPSKMATVARRTADGRHYVLNGEKLWCTNGPVAGLLVVMARTEPKLVGGVERPQITAMVVEGNSPGIEVVHRCDFMGIRGIQNGLLRFTDVLVPVENVLWGPGKGLKLALTTLNTGRLTLPAACTGVAKQCLSIARRWGNQREQWGLPVGDHEEGRHKLAWIGSHTLAMEAVTWLTSHWADDSRRDIRIEAAMAKLFCSEVGWRIVDTTLQMRGGRGYEKASSLLARGEEPWPVERMMRDMRINRIIEGTTEIMRLFLAREAMDPHLRLASDLLKAHVPAGTKIKAGAKLAAFYTGWYAKQWVNPSLWDSRGEYGILGDHIHFVEAQAHHLARTMFHFMGLYRDHLERRQILLGHLVEVGTELFAMSATCAYARKLAEDPEKVTAMELADHFCAEARLRIEEHFRALDRDVDRMAREVGKDVLAGEMAWLEDGVAWLGAKT